MYGAPPCPLPSANGRSVGMRHHDEIVAAAARMLGSAASRDERRRSDAGGRADARRLLPALPTKEALVAEASEPRSTACSPASSEIREARAGRRLEALHQPLPIERAREGARCGCPSPASARMRRARDRRCARRSPIASASRSTSWRPHLTAARPSGRQSCHRFATLVGAVVIARAVGEASSPARSLRLPRSARAVARKLGASSFSSRADSAGVAQRHGSFSCRASSKACANSMAPAFCELLSMRRVNSASSSADVLPITILFT